jgi:hypothetical protein
VHPPTGPWPGAGADTEAAPQQEQQTESAVAAAAVLSSLLEVHSWLQVSVESTGPVEVTACGHLSKQDKAVASNRVNCTQQQTKVKPTLLLY